MKTRIMFFCISCLTMISVTATGAFAAPERNSDEWQFTLAPMFLWGMNIDGTAGVGPIDAPLELDFTDDVLENLAAIFTFHFEAKKKDLTLFAEYQYGEMDPTASVPDGPTVNIDFIVQLAEFGAGYRVATWGNTEVEPILGVRWTSQDLETSFQTGAEFIDSGDDWFDVFAGVRLFTHFSENWTLISRGDIGTGGSDFVWNVSFIVDYRFNNWGSVFAGYRWMDYDYESGSGKDRYAYDALQQGPLAGISFYW